MSELRRRPYQLPFSIVTLANGLTSITHQRKKPPFCGFMCMVTATIMLLLLLDSTMMPVHATPIEIILNTTRNSPYADGGVHKWMTAAVVQKNSDSGISNTTYGGTLNGNGQREESAIEQVMSSTSRLRTKDNSASHVDTLPVVLVPQPTAAPVPPVHTLGLHNSNTNRRERPLKCHCDICKDNNYICETDGYCFTSVEKEADKIIFSYRCLNMSQSFPPGRFIWCNDGSRGGPTARPAAPSGGHACCKEHDLCNLDLRPIIKYYTTNSQQTFEGAQMLISRVDDMFLIFLGAAASVVFLKIAANVK